MRYDLTLQSWSKMVNLGPLTYMHIKLIYVFIYLCDATPYRRSLMLIDKSWINLRNQLSDQYFNGARVFINMAKNYPNEEVLVWCPCRKCVNGLWQEIGVIEAHIINHGLNPLYKKQRYHREPDIFLEPIVHEQGDNSGDEILNVLEDVIGPTHELPTEDENFETEPPQRENLFAEMETEL